MARIRRVVTSRPGGVSEAPYDTFNLSARVGDDPEAVRANRARLAERTGLELDRLVWMDTVHGADVVRVQEPPGRPVRGVDGVVSTTPGLGLVVMAADCVPLLAAADRQGVAAVAHAGRRGAAAGIADSLVRALVDAGARLPDTDVLLGPAICGRCYEVPAQMRDDMERRLPGSASTTSWGTPSLDLPGALRRRLVKLGVGRVVVDSRCTFEDPALYSFRRDGTTGRQAGVAWVS